jgi:RsiW-degrading membrane proteinase PrsW (M82 family)
MLEQMLDFFKSGFVYPGLSWHHALIAIGLAFAFGAVWFTAYWTPILRKPWAWAVLAGSTFLTWAAVAFIQIPLQHWSWEPLYHFWSQTVILDWLLLAGIPAILLSGLVQEGSKLVPIVIYWWRKGRSLDPKMGLIIGAVAGLGFGVFEAVWAHNTLFATYGWNWGMVQTNGVVALAPFWERLFAVGFHIAASALAGYGLAKGWGWQFYMIASGLHALLNYGALLFQAGVLTTVPVEIYVAVLVAFIAAGVLWIRWKKLANSAVELRL